MPALEIIKKSASKNIRYFAELTTVTGGDLYLETKFIRGTSTLETPGEENEHFTTTDLSPRS